MKYYIFGHRNPDTDSIVSTISMANLKEKLGHVASPKRLGNINKETKFVLDHWKVDNIPLIKTIRVQIKDLDIDRIPSIRRDSSIREAYDKISKEGSRLLAITDDEGRLEGIVSLRDIAMGLIEEDYYTIDTSRENIIKNLKGVLLTECDEFIKGKIPMVPSYFDLMESGAKLANDSVLILSDVYDMLENAILRKVKLIIVSGVLSLPDRLINLARENSVVLIATKYDIYRVSRILTMSNYISTIMKTKGIIRFRETEYLEDLKDALMDRPSLTFPVVDSENRYIGFVGRKQVINPKRKKVILLDHNEFQQSAEGIEEAEIVEIHDHHKIGGVNTANPIYFNNKPLGSTSSLVYEQFKLNSLIPERPIAGLILSGILSDTLALTSPTTTEVDKTYAKELSKLLELDYKEYAYKMFKCGTSIEGMSIDQIFNTDYKEFTIEDLVIGISQIFTLDADIILSEKEKYASYINDINKENSQDITIMIITDIMKNGSYIIFSENSENTIETAFDTDCYQGVFIENLVSRKKQVLPNIIKAIYVNK